LEAFAKECTIQPLTLKSIAISADLYAKLRKAGTPIDDIDLLIAGIALATI
jgi:tRNA(fMet)-specific endonuclease VapC